MWKSKHDRNKKDVTKFFLPFHPPACCGQLLQAPHSLCHHHHVTWRHSSPPRSEWTTTPSSPALCTEHNWSALPIIRYINNDWWLLMEVFHRLLLHHFLYAAGSTGRPLSTSALVLDRQSCRSLLSAWSGASGCLLCPQTLWTGESQSHNINSSPNSNFIILLDMSTVHIPRSIVWISLCNVKVFFLFSPSSCIDGGRVWQHHSLSPYCGFTETWAATASPFHSTVTTGWSSSSTAVGLMGEQLQLQVLAWCKHHLPVHRLAFLHQQCKILVNRRLVSWYVSTLLKLITKISKLKVGQQNVRVCGFALAIYCPFPHCVWGVCSFKFQ